MTPDISQWRSSSTYDYVDDLVSPDLAWEWLRRNRDYQHDFRNLVVDAPTVEPGSLRLRQRWGLCFPCSASISRNGHADILDAGGRHQRHSIDGCPVHPSCR